MWDDLGKVKNNTAFAVHMEDILEYRTMECKMEKAVVTEKRRGYHNG